MVLERLLSRRFLLLLLWAGIGYQALRSHQGVVGTVILSVVACMAILWLAEGPEIVPFRVRIFPRFPLLL